MLLRNSSRRGLARYLSLGICALLLLAVVVAIVAYQVSPLRDPSFVAQIKAQGWSEAGATVGWLRPEKYWWMFVTIFSVLFATNVTALAGVKLPILRLFGSTRRPNALLSIFKVSALFVLWILVAYVTWLYTLGYLLSQLIMD